MFGPVGDAIEEIDAAMFSGDTFNEKCNREELKEYIDRWSREIKSIEEFWESEDNEN